MSPICVELPDFSWLRLAGPDARKFLQGYLTCDLDALAADRALLGAYCSIQGRVIADVLVTEIGGSPALWLHASLIAPVVASLRKYLAFSKSKFLEPDGTWVSLGLLAAGTEPGLPAATLAVSAYRGGIAVRVPGEEARWLLGLPAESARTVRSSFESAGRLGDPSLWTRADIKARWPHLTDATTEAFLPQMLGLTDLGAVSFTKGCYLGQEVVARAQHRGQVKRRLVSATWRGVAVPAIGLEVLDPTGRTLGTVVSATRIDDVRGEALLVVVDRAKGTAESATGTSFEWATV